MSIQDSGAAIAVGIDAVIVADHQCHLPTPSVGGVGEILDRFRVSPTLDGLDRLSQRLSEFPGSVAMCEPTSMTWLSIGVAVEHTGCVMSLVGTSHSARLRGALPNAKHRFFQILFRIDVDIAACVGVEIVLPSSTEEVDRRLYGVRLLYCFPVR